MPDTEAGRALLVNEWLTNPYGEAHDAMREAIDAIERQAAARALAEVRERLVCEDPEEPCDADGRDEHRWCDNCIARAAIKEASRD